jgi:hypothetical protein
VRSKQCDWFMLVVTYSAHAMIVGGAIVRLPRDAPHRLPSSNVAPQTTQPVILASDRTPWKNLVEERHRASSNHRGEHACLGHRRLSVGVRAGDTSTQQQFSACHTRTYLGTIPQQPVQENLEVANAPASASFLTHRCNSASVTICHTRLSDCCLFRLLIDCFQCIDIEFCRS